MEIPRILENLGFTKIQADIYITLLTLGNANLETISRKIKKNKKKVYIDLQKLIEKQFITLYTDNNVLYFKPIKPSKLIEDFELKVEKAKIALPELLALDNSNIVKPHITYYEGKEGIINAMEDSLTAQGDILCWADISLAHKTLEEYYPLYIKKKNILNLFVRGIFTDDKKSKEFQKKEKLEKREIRLIPKENFPFKNEINIYNDTVSIISHKELIAIIIKSKDIADTQRSIFKFGWEYAELLSKQKKS